MQRAPGRRVDPEAVGSDVLVKISLRVIAIVHGIMAALFACASFALIVLSFRMGWMALFSNEGGLQGGAPSGGAPQGVIEAIGLLAAAVVALQIAQTIAEEEVIRAAHVSGPTRVRRFLSRFMVVLIVALAIEGLVATFKAVHENPAQLPAAASILIGTAALLAGWGIFIRMNRYAEELEPEAMEEAKREDEKLKQ